MDRAYSWLLPAAGNRHLRLWDVTDLFARITHLITNSGDVSSPASLLYFKQNGGVFTEAHKQDAMEFSHRLKGHLDPTWQEWLEG